MNHVEALRVVTVMITTTESMTSDALFEINYLTVVSMFLYDVTFRMTGINLQPGDVGTVTQRAPVWCANCTTNRKK